MSLLADLSAIVADAFERAGFDRSFGEVVVSARPDLGQFQCNGALAAAKLTGGNPREVAESVIGNLSDNGVFAEASPAGPGFINLVVADAYLADHTNRIEQDRRLGVPTRPARKVVVDYGGPNVAKDLHVGHLRPAVIGESLKRLFRFIGHDVVGDVHLGDWGTPMGQLIVELEERQPDLPYFDPRVTGPYPDASPVTIDDLQEMYPVAAARAAEDLAYGDRTRRATFELQDGRPGYRALWQHFRDVSVAALREVYHDLGVEFDLWHGESTIAGRVAGMVERLVAEGHAVESDGALVIEVAQPADTKEIPPMMLVKSDGATLYTTWDLATIEDRVEQLGTEEMIYVVDVRQSLHFEQVFRAAFKTGIAPPGTILEHAGNGTVNGPDGKPFKTREGGLLRLRDLMAMVDRRAVERLDENALAIDYPDAERREIARQVGLAALKFGELHNHRTSNYVFDIDRFTSFEGKTGPYLLYGAVRIQSILRKAAELGLVPGPVISPAVEPERKLMLGLARLPEVVDRAVEYRAPNHLAEYAYELVTDFNRFYESCHILREQDPERRGSWLALVDCTLRQIRLLLDLLVIEVPERM